MSDAVDDVVGDAVGDAVDDAVGYDDLSIQQEMVVVVVCDDLSIEQRICGAMFGFIVR